MKRAVPVIAAAALVLTGCREDGGPLPPPCDGTGFASVTGGTGLYSHDERPGTSPGVPMSAVPALTDGNVVVSAGVSLGPDSTSFQNVGVDMGRFVAVDVLRIYVRTGGGSLVPAGGIVTFEVFTSDDGITWFAPPRTATRFDVPGSYYEIQFADVTARFFKAVSFGTNSVETLVTEIQPLVSMELCSDAITASDPVY